MIVSVVSSPVCFAVVPAPPRPMQPSARPGAQAERADGHTSRRRGGGRRSRELPAPCSTVHSHSSHLTPHYTILSNIKTLFPSEVAPLYSINYKRKKSTCLRLGRRCTHRAPCARAPRHPISPASRAASPARSPPLAQARTWAPTTTLPTLTWPPSSAPYEPGEATTRVPSVAYGLGVTKRPSGACSASTWSIFR